MEAWSHDRDARVKPVEPAEVKPVELTVMRNVSGQLLFVGIPV